MVYGNLVIVVIVVMAGGQGVGFCVLAFLDLKVQF